MLEVIQKLSDLVTELEQKNKATDALNQQIASRKAIQDDVERKQMAAANQLSARERLVGKLEDLEKGKTELADKLKVYVEDKAKLAKAQEEVAVKEKKLDEAIKATKEAEVRFTTKRDAVEAEKVAMDKEKAIRAKILEEIRKGL